MCMFVAAEVRGQDEIDHAVLSPMYLFRQLFILFTLSESECYCVAIMDRHAQSRRTARRRRRRGCLWYLAIYLAVCVLSRGTAGLVTPVPQRVC